MPNNFNKNANRNTLNLFLDAEQASVYTAKQIAELIVQKQKQGKQAILGLATGNTPKRVYQELIHLHKNEGLSFRNVISFNLDEYYPIAAKDSQSYTYFMYQNLFDHIDVDPSNIHIPHTDNSLAHIPQYCEDYENKIAHFGGLDLQLLGIGRNGHIGFNEPGSSFESNTRLVNLHELTREDAQDFFGTLDKVPHQAISIGIDTILKAKKILLLALGERKSEIISKALEGEISTQIPASILQTIPQVEYILDRDAAALIQK
ncbi:glucosamine-6-phosphate deaminase [Aequorivita marina]|uniref:glucosamine-6-phosphate deaminase n=1 Tax=Aequorivita marina TaxID=3073654 RepID=UPI0028753B0A|nr:glucosamine-6-phosphate deaminase [Aequorivita sp. S2608]MDS1299107.1 glucosamine-6-phosphate deaminase [Aequorivita sp. S2608]